MVSTCAPDARSSVVARHARGTARARWLRAGCSSPFTIRRMRRRRSVTTSSSKRAARGLPGRGRDPAFVRGDDGADRRRSAMIRARRIRRSPGPAYDTPWERSSIGRPAEINARRGRRCARSVRALLGDPPIDWEKVETAGGASPLDRDALTRFRADLRPAGCLSEADAGAAPASTGSRCTFTGKNISACTYERRRARPETDRAAASKRRSGRARSAPISPPDVSVAAARCRVVRSPAASADRPRHRARRG